MHRISRSKCTAVFYELKSSFKIILFCILYADFERLLFSLCEDRQTKYKQKDGDWVEEGT